NLQLNGATGTITNAVTFLNTGTLTLGASGGTQTYTAGFTATAPSATTLNGIINTAAGAVSIGGATQTITLGSATTIQTYSGSGSGANITISGPIQGTAANTQNLNLYSKAGVISLTGAIGSTTALGTVTLGDTSQTGAISASGAITATAVSIPAAAYNLSLTGNGSTITNAVTFLNTGTLTLGASGGTQTYTAGF
ncbi:hypothetical protein ICE90_10740, partial [Polynucleobacter sp. AP-RePozz3-80-G7]|nr:hypothetical protein [Polynucleobacter sp. AP-RePozz3-80-G7]